MVKLAVLAGVGAMLASTSTGSAQSADALIDKLVEKGVLSVKEANELREEADKNFTQAYSVKSGMPEWVTSLKFNGDFRGRFEGFYSDNDDYVDRNRWRYRARFGMTATLLEGFEIGLRLGSGDIDSYPTAGVDPISNNQTFSNNGSKKGIFLDLAYGKWTPWNGPKGSASMALGKIENPFVFSDLVFDADYTPEGLGMQFSYNLADNHALKANLGGFALDEIGASTEDPYLLGAQVRMESTWNQHLASSAGVSVLGITADNLLLTTLYYRFNENWGTRISHQYQALDGTLEEQHYSIYRDFRSWTGALTFRIRDNRTGPKDYTVAVTFSMKAFPRFSVDDDRVRPSSLLGY